MQGSFSRAGSSASPGNRTRRAPSAADWGNEGAPTALLVHGMRDHCHTWDGVAARLRDRFHVVAPDLRGHGDSGWSVGSSYSHADYIYELAQLVRQARLEPVTLIAHSMGGTLACQFAGIYPDRVARMIIIEGVGHWWRFFNQPPVHERLATWIDGIRDLSARQAKRYATLEEAYQRMQKTNPHLTPEQALHLTLHGSHQKGNTAATRLSLPGTRTCVTRATSPSRNSKAARTASRKNKACASRHTLQTPF